MLFFLLFFYFCWKVWVDYLCWDAAFSRRSEIGGVHFAFVAADSAGKGNGLEGGGQRSCTLLALDLGGMAVDGSA